MNFSKKIYLFLLLSLFFYSCIKDEGPDREADIIEFTVENDPNVIFTRVVFQNGIHQVQITVVDTAGYANKIITPIIEISKGATIKPQSGEAIQLKDYKASYEVTAEDGNVKHYEVVVTPPILLYDFNKWTTATSNGFEYDVYDNSRWTNANKGVSFRFVKGREFPTRKTTDCISKPYAVLLETIEGLRSETFILDIPLYAGNMYTGSFVTTLSDPISSAKFGQPYLKEEGKPVRFAGYFKYLPGDEFTACEVINEGGRKRNNVYIDPNRNDECDIYAVLFKVDKSEDVNKVFLNANTVQTSENIVARAELNDQGARPMWSKFDIPFEYTEELNYDLYNYKLAIVMSSSKRGAFYEGAIGSKLFIDDIEIVTESFN